MTVAFSCQFCGSTIAGLSLLSDSIMRLVPENNSTDWVDLLLSRRSLYILRYPMYFLLFTTKLYFAYHKMGTSISKAVKHFLFISTGMMLVLNSPMKSWKMKIPFSQGRRFHVIAASLWSVETCLCKGIETGLTIAPALETLWLTRSWHIVHLSNTLI